jgi:hypothetical protein
VTPAPSSTVPDAPTIGTATAGNTQATVTFTAPASDGGSAITSYTATSSPGFITGSCTAPCTSITVSGLTNGAAYTFTVTATKQHWYRCCFRTFEQRDARRAGDRTWCAYHRHSLLQATRKRR